MKKMREQSNIYLSLAIVSLLLCSCVPTPGDKTNANKVSNGGSVTLIPNESPFISGVPTVVTNQDLYYSWAPTLHDTGLRFTATGLPDWLSIHESTGVLSGIPRESGTTDNIRITAFKSNRFTEIGPFSVQVYGDPLKVYAWHMRNTGQSNFANNGGTSGEDLNLDEVLRTGNFGADIKVGVSDSGLDIDHPDLFVNVLNPLNKDYKTSAPYFGDPGVTTGGDHGTSVAGIIAAVGWNGIGSRGIAPKAKLVGLNYLGTGVTQSTAIQLDQASGDLDVYNYSYGSSFYPMAQNADSTYIDQVKYGLGNQRGGKGSVYVKSAGNSFQECDFSHSGMFLGLLCFSHNSNLGAEDELPWYIVVGATNALGVKSSYSSEGANLWVSAPGGEFGKTNPAILTTDTAGCADGYARFGLTGINFLKGGDGNTDCDYTQNFNGSSSAAPMVSGLVALLLDANANLTWRDVKHILAVTAEKVDAASSDTLVIEDFDFDNGPYVTVDNDDMIGHTYSQGWTTNSAGYSFHNYYGFGQVDVDAAVTMAKSYSSFLTGMPSETDPAFSLSTSSVNTAIPNSSVTGLSDSININQSYTVEAVQIKVNITHPRPGDLGIELTSPSGTKSIILNINNSLLI
ncbi:MAG: S8 family serine peptidase, partial [Bacteriovoracaceae bacterium]|nr:S8 family serine peptidase [Bacteriovoracaceae bacterium]